MSKTTDIVSIFSTKSAADAAKPNADEIGKKKLYCVTLPSPEALAAHIKLHGQEAWLWSDGYAPSAYQVLRIAGGSVGTAPASKVGKAELEAAQKAKEEAEAKAKAHEDKIATLMAKMAEYEAKIASGNGSTHEPTPAKKGRS